MACMFFYLIPIRKKTVFGNLRSVFPNYSETQIKKIAFNSYKSFAITIIEILNIPYLSKEEVLNTVVFENTDLLLKKYNERNGVILLTAHFGNWELSALSLGMRLNIPISIIVKTQRNNFVSDWLNNMRSKYGNKIVNLGISIRQIYTELKAKNIIALVGDQRASRESLRMDFLGISTTVYEGPAVLSLKTNAPIIVGIPVRQKNYTYKISFVEVNRDNLPLDNEGRIKELTRRHINILEDYINEYPDQWLWMHKRWKY
jgi:Lauroyl/myristoyl acyltransferase